MRDLFINTLIIIINLYKKNNNKKLIIPNQNNQIMFSYRSNNIVIFVHYWSYKIYSYNIHALCIECCMCVLLSFRSVGHISRYSVSRPSKWLVLINIERVSVVLITFSGVNSRYVILPNTFLIVVISHIANKKVYFGLSLSYYRVLYLYIN